MHYMMVVLIFLSFIYSVLGALKKIFKIYIKHKLSEAYNYLCYC